MTQALIAYAIAIKGIATRSWPNRAVKRLWATDAPLRESSTQIEQRQNAALAAQDRPGQSVAEGVDEVRLLGAPS